MQGSALNTIAEKNGFPKVLTALAPMTWMSQARNRKLTQSVHKAFRDQETDIH